MTLLLTVKCQTGKLGIIKMTKILQQYKNEILFKHLLDLSNLTTTGMLLKQRQNSLKVQNKRFKNPIRSFAIILKYETLGIILRFFMQTETFFILKTSILTDRFPLFFTSFRQISLKTPWPDHKLCFMFVPTGNSLKIANRRNEIFKGDDVSQ